MNHDTPLVLRDLTRTFGAGSTAVTAVRHASLEVHDGEILAVVGPSGSGKTTLLSMAGCLLTPSSGEVVVLGREVSRLGHAERSAMRLAHLGFVFQSFNLLEALTARENIEIALNLGGTRGRAARMRSDLLLELLDLRDRAGNRPGDLSGGEQQRLAVARALANRPEIILADEPTASLDSQAGRRVMELIRQAVAAKEARCVVVVTHDTRILDLANRMMTMEDGILRPADRDVAEPAPRAST